MSKDLQYYLDNPDEVPSDPAVLAALAEQMNGAAPAVDGDASESGEKAAPRAEGEAGDPSTATAADTSKVTEGKTQESEAANANEEAPIATRDGKRTIPYEVLRTERERRQAAESAVAELSQQVEEIRAQLSKGTVAGTAEAAAAVERATEALSPEDLEALREDFPNFGKVIDNLMSTIDGLSNKVAELASKDVARETEVQSVVAKTVQEMIDDDPVLVHLQTNEPKLFMRAVELDNSLKADFPDMGARFEKVSKMMWDLYGPFEGVTLETPAAEASPSVSKEAAKEAVKEALRAAKPAKPATLSDLPTGEPPASSEQNELESLSSVEIGAKLMSMTVDQRQAFLNRL